MPLKYRSSGGHAIKMSTTDTQIQSTVTRDIDWARHHFIVIIAGIVLAATSVFGIESLFARRAHDQWQQALGLFNQMQKQNEQVQASTQAQIKTLTDQNAVLTQQFQAAMASIAARDAQLLKDRGEIKSLPPTALATKWGASANEPAPVVQANGDFDVPITLAQKSYDALLQVPVLTKDNTDLKSAVANKTQEAANNEQKFESEQKAHTSDTETCKQNVNTLNAQITSIKADAKKDNFIAAFVGTVIGYALGSRHR